jgi:uncharacterized membrane protein
MGKFNPSFEDVGILFICLVGGLLLLSTGILDVNEPTTRVRGILMIVGGVVLLLYFLGLMAFSYERTPKKMASSETLELGVPASPHTSTS